MTNAAPPSSASPAASSPSCGGASGLIGVTVAGRASQRPAARAAGKRARRAGLRHLGPPLRARRGLARRRSRGNLAPPARRSQTGAPRALCQPGRAHSRPVRPPQTRRQSRVLRACWQSGVRRAAYPRAISHDSARLVPLAPFVPIAQAQACGKAVGKPVWRAQVPARQGSA